MIIGAIIVGILICTLGILSTFLSESDTNKFDIGVIIGGIEMVLIIIEVNLLSNIIGKPTPSAIDVYRGNTELEIKSVNGTPIDTVVVFKENNYRK